MECRKICYNLKEARSELNVVKKLGKKYRHEKRIYFCKECQAHHLTSEEEYEQRIYLKQEELIFANKWKNLLGN